MSAAVIVTVLVTVVVAVAEYRQQSTNWGMKQCSVFLELLTVLILAAWPVLLLIYHILLLDCWYFGRYFEH